MSAAPEPVEPAAPPGTPELTEAAQLARERLHHEIERVRNGVEDMLDEQENGRGIRNDELRIELERLRLETRDYVKRKVRKSEKRLERSVQELELRIDQVEIDQEAAETRIHNSTEEMLDSLLLDIRSIADRLAEPSPPAPAQIAPGLTPPPNAMQPPQPLPPPPPPPNPPVPPHQPPTPEGRLGPLPFGRGRQR